ncbi:IclR family transcriptional regulator [Psychrosphaera sp. 1_MG-2023]|uniref:IclR family transcriptional regulator n=1 Tax=Psychrosphaera sp. 1_MG-2023 TaxID=3062643 RepID=UPI0026E3C2BF|nr:IclR family transcriptional regulator [Psychrosphaera sp. 1_MG-2023]MDO6719428.1 IclR family transcriptional regulator [Psychrosphaera sp. 1_MG-2023]
MIEKNENKYAVPALDKALDVLEFLASQITPKSQTEIAHQLGRSANEIYRVLIGLEHRGYLTRDESSGKYSVSLKLYNLSRSISPIDEIRQVALPHMEDLAVDIGMSCHLSVLYQSQVMVLVHARSHSPVSLNISEGALFHPVKSISGQVLLANSNEQVKAMILQRDNDFVNSSSNEKAEFETKLATYSKQKHFVGNSTITPGVFELATLIGEAEGKIIASLAVSSLEPLDCHAADFQSLKAKLMATAAAITKQLMG